MENPSDLKSSSSPEPSSLSTSLEGYASGSESSSFFSASSELPSPSTSTSITEIGSSPNNEQKENLEFLSEELHKQWKKDLIRAFSERMACSRLGALISRIGGFEEE